MASSPQRVLRVVEECKISPPQGSVPSTTLPLTFFDIPWLLVPPSQPLFFFPLATTAAASFTHSILPALKLSLSIALQRFFPLAGNLSALPPPSKPQLTYSPGDSVSLTVAESNADFAHLSGHHARAAREFHLLAPPLPLPSSLLAVQITVFPVSGVCVGFALRHVAADGRTFHNFLKAWTSIHRLRLGLDSLLPSLNPSLDRLVIRDPNLLEAVLLKQWWSLSSQGHFVADRRVSSEDMVRATFVMGRPDMEKLKHLILIRSKTLFGSDPLYLSPYVIACAVIWVCLTKVNGGGSPEERRYFGFIAGGITRLGYSVPTNYLGNCVSFGRSTAQGAELVGKDGIVIAAKAIGDTVKRLNAAVLGGAESWIPDWKEMFRSELHVMVTGSPKLDLYGLDFGWGRPKKIEEMSIDRTGAVSLARSTGLEGGIEIGLALPPAKMEAFSSLFNCL